MSKSTLGRIAPTIESKATYTITLTEPTDELWIHLPSGLSLHVTDQTTRYADPHADPKSLKPRVRVFGYNNDKPATGVFATVNPGEDAAYFGEPEPESVS